MVLLPVEKAEEEADGGGGVGAAAAGRPPPRKEEEVDHVGRAPPLLPPRPPKLSQRAITQETLRRLAEEKRAPFSFLGPLLPSGRPPTGRRSDHYYRRPRSAGDDATS